MLTSKNLWIYKNNGQSEENPIRTLGISPITAKVLINRGIKNSGDMISFLNPDYSGLHDPFLLKDMEKAVNRILEALRKNQKITIYGDYDVDGITSTSILFLFLKENGGDVDYYIPNRIEEGYGLNVNAIKKIKDSGTELMITVDTGIAAVNEAQYAKELGVDLIITDHHECQSEIPIGYAVIDPKQEACEYPFDLLAGVGVTFKLIHGLSKKLNNEDRIWKYIDIAAIGTVADVVPLIDENRIIVKKGFESIPNTWNIGLKALLKVAGYKGGDITTGLVGFGIAPRLNAAGRIGDAKRGIELFITKDEEKAVLLAEELNEENKNRQAMEQTILEEALELIDQELDMEKTKVIVIASEKWHHGVIGIVASRIMEKFYRPTILMCVEEGMAKGSARSVEGFNIFEALCESSQFLDKFGGHEMAAGLSMAVEHVNEFRNFINDYANIKMDEDTLTPKIYLDDKIKPQDINLEVISELEKMEPFGVGNPKPLFSYEGEIQSLRPVGQEGKHLKLSFKDINKPLDAIGFGFGEYSKELALGQRVSTVVALERNEWNHIIKPQLLIRDMKGTKEDEIIYKYYISLYNLFKEIELGNNKTSVDTNVGVNISMEELINYENTIVVVNALFNVFKINKYIKNNLNSFTIKPKVWYTNICGHNTKYDIVINPKINKIDMDHYENIILFDPLWDVKAYNFFKDKQNIFRIDNDFSAKKDAIKSLVPHREDFAALYRYLKLLNGLNLYSIDLNVLIQECRKTVTTNLFKILLCMDVFNELNLIRYNFKEDTIFFEFLSNNKIILEDSKILQKITNWSEEL